MRKSPPLNALRTFEAVAYHLSFAKAAKELNVTPTAISHQVRQLEKFIGQPLFRRFPRPISMTIAGEKLYPVLRNGFEKITSTLESIQENKELKPLVISTTPAFASFWLLPRLAKLKDETGLELEIKASEKLEKLRAGHIECAIRYTRKKPKDYEARILTSDHYFTVAHPEYLTNQENISWSDIKLINYSWKNESLSPPDWNKYLIALEEDGVDVSDVDISAALRFSEESHAIESAMAGLGVALVSNILIKSELAKGKLLRIGQTAIEGLSFYMVYPKNTPRRKQIEDFILWIRDEMMDDEEL